MTKLYDPITDEELVIYCCENDSEVYRCNEDKAIQVIINELGFPRDEAIRILVNSDIDHPVNCTICEFWSEAK